MYSVDFCALNILKNARTFTVQLHLLIFSSNNIPAGVFPFVSFVPRKETDNELERAGWPNCRVVVQLISTGSLCSPRGKQRKLQGKDWALLFSPPSLFVAIKQQGRRNSRWIRHAKANDVTERLKKPLLRIRFRKRDDQPRGRDSL